MRLSTAQMLAMTVPMGAVEEQTRDVAVAVMRELGSRGLSVRNLWGYDPNPDNPEHHSGRAIDFMVDELDDPTGDAVCEILWSNRDQWGLQHMIWRQRIKSTDPDYSPGQWVWMADRGSTTNNHRDHVHAMFYEGFADGVPSVAIDSDEEEDDDMFTDKDREDLQETRKAAAWLQERLAQNHREDYQMQAAILAAVSIENVDEAELAEALAKRGVTFGSDPKALAAAVVAALAQLFGKTPAGPR